MVFQEQGIGLSYGHVALIADAMTHYGAPQSLLSSSYEGLHEHSPFTRYEKKNQSIHMHWLIFSHRCCVKDELKTLLKAARMGESSSVMSITDSVITARLPKFGTGAFELAFSPHVKQ